MIELPADPSPREVVPALRDFGLTIEPSTGAAASRVERKGSRFRAQVTYPPMTPDDAEVFVSRLLRGKRLGVRIPMPLIRPQGSPGSPVVDGAGQSGFTLAVRGLSPGYTVKEGYWLSIEDSTGQHYLHKTAGAVMADASGDAEIEIEPALRKAFADGDTIHLAVPMIEGLVQGNEWEWTIPVEKLVVVQFGLAEVA